MKQLNWYQIFGKSNIPDGKTVLPTDDIQIWLKCAGLNLPYTTLSEVLADTDTLLALITSDNAVDYMVRSTTWAAPITVPKMTSNTTPSGVASCDKNYTSDPAWHAFDQDTSTQWSTYQQSNPTSGKVRYQFTTPVAITTVTALIPYDSGYRARDYKVNASSDGITYQTLASGTFTSKSVTSTETITFSNTDKYLYWELEIDSTYSGAVNVKILQFYSDSVTTSADAMTYIGQNNYAANTLIADATWKEAICNSAYIESVLNVKVPLGGTAIMTAGSWAYNPQDKNINNVFDGNTSTSTYTTSGGFPWGMGYHFDRSVKIVAFRYFYATGIVNANPVVNRTGHKFRIRHSDDGTTWTDISSFQGDSCVWWDKVTPISEDGSHEYYDIYLENNNLLYGANHDFTFTRINELQFYGREDV